MKTLKKTARFLALTVIIIAAASGAGFLAVFAPRTKYMDKEIRIERVEKNSNDEDENNQEKKN